MYCTVYTFVKSHCIIYGSTLMYNRLSFRIFPVKRIEITFRFRDGFYVEAFSLWRGDPIAELAIVADSEEPAGSSLVDMSGIAVIAHSTNSAREQNTDKLCAKSIRAPFIWLCLCTLYSTFLHIHCKVRVQQHVLRVETIYTVLTGSKISYSVCI